MLSGDAGPCCTFEELPCTFPAAAAALSVEAAAVQKSAEICRASGLSASSVVLGVLSSGVLPQKWCSPSVVAARTLRPFDSHSPAPVFARSRWSFVVWPNLTSIHS